MNCHQCGAPLQEGAKFCEKCGARVGEGAATVTQPVQEEIHNYLVQAILVTLLCCLPFGIVSIVYAAQVNTKVAAGDLEGARKSSNEAKKWAWIGFGSGLVVAVLYTILVIIGIAAGA